jgi:uncharacterized membrane protein YecN with MAPEG domain
VDATVARCRTAVRANILALCKCIRQAEVCAPVVETVPIDVVYLLAIALMQPEQNSVHQSSLPTAFALSVSRHSIVIPHNPPSMGGQ